MKDEEIVEKVKIKYTDEDQRIGLDTDKAILGAINLARQDERLSILPLIPPKRKKPCPHCNGIGFVEVDEK